MELLKATIKLDDVQVVTLAAAILWSQQGNQITADHAVRQAKQLLHAAQAQMDIPFRLSKIPGNVSSGSGR